MTIIAVKDRTMAADSFSFAGEVGVPLADMDAKITRAPNGDLVGACGPSIDCYALRLWVKDGMDFKRLPKFVHEANDKDGIYWFWLRMDGYLLAGEANMGVYPMSLPATCGAAGASDMALGMMLAGASAEEAVKQVVGRCNNVGGPVQVELLE